MSHHGYSHLTALVVEPDPAQRAQVELVLAEFGITARQAVTAGEMIASIRAAKPDLLLVDFGATSDGRALVDAVRGAGFTGPAVAMAGDSLRHGTFYMDAMEHFDACVAKPLTASTMVRMLRQLIAPGA